MVSSQNSYTFKLSYMSLLPARIKMIGLKMKELECSNQFSRRSRAANSAVLGPIWSNFELVSDVMDVLVTCKNEEDPIKMKTLEWSQDFPHYNPMGAICNHRNQSSDSIYLKTQCSLSPTPMLLQLKFDCSRSTGCGVIHV